MNEKLKRQWFTIPTIIRKPVVFIAGMVFIVAAILTGWLPGPGGIPLFLVGIAILSTEFTWAKRVRDIVLRIIHAVSQWYRRHSTKIKILVITTILLIIFGFFYLLKSIFFHK